jgi:hypothetical protein
MKTKLISISVDGLEVIGKITRRENYYLEVEILQPYVNWKNYRSVSPVILRNSPNPFINSWKEMSEEILLNSYKKLKSIDENLDSIVKDYEDLNEEINAVSVLDNDLKKRIIKKLRDQFFRNDLFVSSVTGLIATYHDEAIIEKIINTYRSEKKKIYLKNDFMSLKIPFKEMDIQTLNQKIHGLEYWFKEDTKYITDEKLDHYNLLKERVLDLIENRNNIEK